MDLRIDVDSPGSPDDLDPDSPISPGSEPSPHFTFSPETIGRQHVGTGPAFPVHVNGQYGNPHR